MSKALTRRQHAVQTVVGSSTRRHSSPETVRAAHRFQAPRQTAPAAAGATPAAPEAVTLSRKTAQLVEAIKGQFQAFTANFELLTQSRAQLAPKFMRAFGAWQSETGGAFVAFVRVLDPSVPADRDGYRSHPSYAAADYLRRLQSADKEAEDVDDSERPVAPVQVIAMLIATLMPVIDDINALWDAFERKLKWTPRQIATLQQQVAQAPALLVKAPAERRLHAERKAS